MPKVPGKGGLSAFEHLEKFLHSAGKGVGDLKGMQLKDVPGKAYGQVKKTGSAMMEHPRAAIGGAAGGAAGLAGMQGLLDDDEDDLTDAERQKMMAYIRGGGGY